MIPTRTRPSAPSCPEIETVQHRLARLRLEQTPRRRYNAPRSARGPTPSTGPHSSAAAWLRPHSAPARTSNGVPRRTVGPPPPPSWSQLPSSPSPSPSPRIRPRQFAHRSKIARPLTAAGRAQCDEFNSLFNIAATTLARDLARGPRQSLLLEHVAYLPTHLKLRILDVIADWRNESNLTNSGARELLRTDLDYCHDHDGDGPRETDWEDWDTNSVEGSNVSTLSRDDFSTPLATALTVLNLSFSSISLKTLRSILLTPRSASSSALAATATGPPPPQPKLVARFSHLHSLVLCSVRHVPILHDDFFHLLSVLLSLRSLSLAGNSFSVSVSVSSSSSSSSSPDELLVDSCCPPNAFVSRLASATPQLRLVDLSYLEGRRRGPPADDNDNDDDGLPRFDPTRAVHAVDWSTKWLDLKVLGLRGSMMTTTTTTTTTTDRTKSRRKDKAGGEGGDDDDDDEERSTRIAATKFTRDLIMAQRKRAKWIDVVF